MGADLFDLDYFWFFDLGQFAVSNFCARYLAMHKPEKINEVISTSLFYFSIIGIVAWTLSPLLARNAHCFFKISPANRRSSPCSS